MIQVHLPALNCAAIDVVTVAAPLVLPLTAVDTVCGSGESGDDSQLAGPDAEANVWSVGEFDSRLIYK